MKVTRSISTTKRLCRAFKGPIVLVPTMGALHRGHTTLVDRARKLVGPKGLVVTSVFVNPTQFGPKEDFSRYPEPFQNDRKLCAEHGVDLLFHPEAAEMYPPNFSTHVDEDSVSTRLCGASRPGHFRGVCTVVAKLLNIVNPDFALFGLKDFQQYTVLRQMVRDLDMDVEIVHVETAREPDGLALSSRNQFLGLEERAQAPVLQHALQRAREAVERGQTSAARLRALIIATLAKAPLARIDYVEIVDADSLQPITKMRPHALIAVAAFFGTTRLIDNLWLK